MWNVVIIVETFLRSLICFWRESVRNYPERMHDNAAYQLFSGKGIVAGWRPPDHTKVEEFRSRLSPETQRVLANEIAKAAGALKSASADKGY